MKELEETAKFFHGKEVDGKKLVGITLPARRRRPPRVGRFSYASAVHGPTRKASPISLPQRASRPSSFTASAEKMYGPQGGTMLLLAESTSGLHGGQAAMIYDANVFKSLYEEPKESKVAGQVGYAVIRPVRKACSCRTFPLESGDTPGQHAQRQKRRGLFVQWATNKANGLGAQLAVSRRTEIGMAIQGISRRATGSRTGPWRR